MAESSNTQASLGVREIRRVYLITYSQADTLKVSSRQRFANLVLEAFHFRDENTESRVEQWSCCLEYHADGGIHFHMAIKLSKPRRWLAVRQFMQSRYSINVHFSNRHVNYYSAWLYVTKEDSEVLHSPGHPDLWNSQPPVTTAASEAVAADRAAITSTQSEETESEEESTPTTSGRKRKRAPRLSMFEVSEIAVSKGIKSYLGLLALAKRQKTEGKTDLAQFIVNRGKKAVEEAIKTGWEIEESEEKLKRQQMSRLEILQAALEGDCTHNCNGRWLTMAKDILDRNGITQTEFGAAVHELLDKGRGKYRNIFLKGGANRGKTFLLNPLTVIYKTFVNPASKSFAWVGAENAEIIFLNDFRWSAQVLPWQDMLLLLEGQPVHFSVPKTHYAQDIVFDKDTPIFCTSKSEIISLRNGVVDDRETEMMAVRWRVFSLHAQILQEEQVIIESCPKCFAQLILE